MMEYGGIDLFKSREIILDLLIEIQLFQELTPKELEIISKYMTFFEINEGEALFREGDTGDFMCFVVKGSVDILKESASGRTVVIANLGRGRSIGEMAIIDKTPRSATVKAKTFTTLLVLSRKGFDTIVEKHPGIGIKILKGLARLLSLNMRATSSKLADYMNPI
ncbi:cyclic nucleotide-binding domain-containing protein [Desulforegula conservatrix]|uniref:cyclic nucleotide-binding domain-containing protein n=1 Tax=Desulforegula conservatrix TaxID=153026 RepID=UPI0004830F8E|nr:cyclic nucleotide-binding domain-containing protein [Desulforegula conservatrix]